MTLLAGLSGCGPEPSEPTSQPPSDVRGDTTINPLLLKLMRDHGLEANLSNGWILVPDCPRICGAVVRETQPRADVTCVQIDVYVDVAPDHILVESFGGFGTTKVDAIADGIHNFVANSFHVILAAFYGDRDDQVDSEQWTIDGTPRRVTIGNVGIRGTLPNPDEPPIEWLKHLEATIKGSSLARGTHWIRCYYAQMQSEPTAVEVLLDNDDWSPIQTKMASIDWPNLSCDSRRRMTKSVNRSGSIFGDSARKLLQRRLVIRPSL